MGIMDGDDNRVKIIYLLCILLCILAIISAVSTFLIGIIICIATFGVSICGALGARFKSSRLLWYFMAGLAILILLALVDVLWLGVTKRSFNAWMVKDFILIIIYGIGIFTSFLLRGRSFRLHPAPSANFQKL